jgi:hypothetical protein
MVLILKTHAISRAWILRNHRAKALRRRNFCYTFETSTFDNPAVLPSVVHVLSTCRLSAEYWLKPGGNRGDIADQIDSMFSARGWKEARLDLETTGILCSKVKTMIGTLPPVHQEG